MGKYVNSVSSREAKKEDAPSLLKLLDQLGYPDLNSSDFDRTFDEVLSSHHSRLLVAETNTGEILGYILFTSRPQLRLCGDSIEIDELSVSESSRGRGVGTALLDKAKEFAISRKAKRLILSTNRDRESYQRHFYQKYGFEEKNSAWLKLDL
jgi:ribosomal protein S18 acetylase RimI-like enzyme